MNNHTVFSERGRRRGRNAILPTGPVLFAFGGLDQIFNRGDWGGFDLFGDDIGEIAVDPDIGHQKLVDQALIGINVMTQHLEHVIHPAAKRIAFDDFGDVLHGAFENLEIIMLVMTQLVQLSVIEWWQQ